jgi:hypothetical protein
MPTQSFKVGEMLNKRTKNTKTWINFDGSFTTEIHSGNVHFEDENGNLQNINTDLMDEADFDSIDIPVAKEGKEKFKEAKDKAKADKKANKLNRDSFDYQGIFVPFETKIPRNFKKGYTIGKGQDKLTFKPVGASPAVGYINGQKNVIDYQDAWNDTDVTLEITSNGIKETMILKTDRAPSSFSFEVFGDISDELTAGTLKLSPAWLEDANNEKRDVAQTIRREGDKTYIDLVADVTGLVYPIEIDPTVVIQPEIPVGKDTWIEPGTNGNTIYGLQTQIHAGWNGAVYQRALLQFNLSSIPTGVEITDATLTLKMVGNRDAASYNFDLHKITQAWAEDQTHWNNAPTFESVPFLTTAFQLAGSYPISIVNAVNSWVNDGFVNNGLLIKVSPETTINSQKTFASSDNATVADRPKLSITYNQPPTAPTVTAPNGGETWNSSHTVVWNPATDMADTETINTTSGYADNIGGMGSATSFQELTIPAGKPLKAVLVAIAKMGGTFKLRLASLDETIIYKEQSFSGTSSTTTTIMLPKLTLDSTITFPVDTQVKIIYDNTVDVVSMGIYGAMTNSYTVGRFNFVGSYYTDRDAHVKIEFDKSTGQSQLKYQIQLTTDGANWLDIVALTTAGATQFVYDFINKPQTSLAKIRIRAYDGSAYGPWDESNGVFSIIHNVAPTAPTNLTPVTVKDRALATRFAWQHNDPNADEQSKFDLEWRLQGSSTWNYVTQNTINQFYELPANTLPRGTIEWRVRTYDQSDLSGPYSELKTFLAGDKPSKPTALNPIDGSIVSVSNPTVEWSSVGQVGYALKVLDATESNVLWETNQISNNKAHTVGYDLQNEADYVIQLTINNSDGLSSDVENPNIHVSYTPPALPIVTSTTNKAGIVLNFSNPIPQGTQPNIISNDVYKKIGEDWVLIAVDVESPFVDYMVAKGKNYEYRILAKGDNETNSMSEVVLNNVSFIGTWLHIADLPSTLHQFKYVESSLENTFDTPFDKRKYSGRSKPVFVFNNYEEQSISLTFNILQREEDFMVLKELYSYHLPITYRDGRGRMMVGVFGSLPSKDTFYGNSVSVTFEEVDYVEGV